MNTYEQTAQDQAEAAEQVKTLAAGEAVQQAVAVAAVPLDKNKLALSPQDRTRVMSAIAFHVNGYSVPKPNSNGVTLYQRIHSELFLNNFFENNMALINKLGPLPEFSFFRTIHDDLIGKKVTMLLINGLVVTGYLGVNGYNGEIFDREKPFGPVEGEGVTNVKPVPMIYVKMNTDEVNPVSGESTSIEELSFITVVAVNDRLPTDEIPVLDLNYYESVPVPLMNDEARNTKIITKHREDVAKRKEHETLQAARRKKNLAERKARRNNRKK